jgi:hypothetical protein
MGKNMAEKIAAQFDNYGQVFKKNGVRITDICESAAKTEEWEHGHRTGDAKYIFPDGSIIIISGDCWDYGYQNCFCMRASGHGDNCNSEEK